MRDCGNVWCLVLLGCTAQLPVCYGHALPDTRTWLRLVGLGGGVVVWLSWWGRGPQMCCHEKDAPEKEKKKCHVPWAQLEHLKQPASWKSRHTDDVPPPFMWPDDEDFKLYVKPR